jgi:hypothetical protein
MSSIGTTPHSPGDSAYEALFPATHKKQQVTPATDKKKEAGQAEFVSMGVLGELLAAHTRALSQQMTRQSVEVQKAMLADVARQKEVQVQARPTTKTQPPALGFGLPSELALVARAAQQIVPLVAEMVSRITSEIGRPKVAVPLAKPFLRGIYMKGVANVGTELLQDKVYPNGVVLPDTFAVCFPMPTTVKAFLLQCKWPTDMGGAPLPLSFSISLLRQSDDGSQTSFESNCVGHRFVATEFGLQARFCGQRQHDNVVAIRVSVHRDALVELSTTVDTVLRGTMVSILV